MFEELADLYPAEIGKASQVSLLAGNTDYSDENSLDQLKKLTTELVTLLSVHAQKEDDIVLPALEAKAQATS